MMNKQTIWMVSVCTIAWCAAAQAAPVAYWRHEEGTNGGLIAAGNDTVVDSTGSGNHMQTFDPTFTSASYTSAVSPLPLRSGLPNTLALDFGPGGDGPDRNDDNFTANDKPIETHLFSNLTVELAFKMDSVDGFQALVGKDGCPLCPGNVPPGQDRPVPPFKVLIRNDDFPDSIPKQLFIEWIDGDGDVHFVNSGQTTTVGSWNHVAFVLTATDAQLWVAGETTPYTLLDSISGDFAGADGRVLINDPTPWTAGRGMFNNGITDWVDARIDEVRIGDTALSPNEFLFVAVPEPHTILLTLMAILAMGLTRARRT
jgi:hypothetical protein